MDLLRDARHTFRLLLKSPGYTLAALLTLALAIGANSAIFGAVHSVLLKPLPIRDPGDLVVAWETDPSRNLAVVEVSYRTFERWALDARSFTHAAAIGSSTWPAILRTPGESSRVATSGVSSSFFETLGAPPLLGRTLRAADDDASAPAVAVLSYGLWARRFGADPGVLGTMVDLDRRRDIVGVMPKGFDFPRGTDFWIPVGPILSAVAKPGLDPMRQIGVLFVIGRLRTGVTPEMAAEDLEAVMSDPSAGRATERFGTAVVVTPFLDYVLGPVRQALWALWAAVGILLLIACANVSGLMLTRVSLRQHEHAIRLALGAARARIGRLWAIESAVLALGGGALGLLSSRWVLKAIIALAPGDVPRLNEAAMSVPVAFFTLVAASTAALLCGLGPIRQAAAANLVDALNDSSRSTPGRRTRSMRSALVAIQIALAVTLLVCAGLVVRSFVALRQVDVGFVTADVVTMFVGPQSNERTHELLMRLQALPQVKAAGAVWLRPLELGPIGQEQSVILDGQADTRRTRQGNPTLNYQVATPGYFEAMRIKLLRGRFFSPADGPQSPRVAIVGESTARRLWPGQNPIGKRLFLPTSAPTETAPAWRTVVGVVGDVNYRGLGDVRLDVYDAALQSTSTPNYLVVRASGDPIAVASAVRAEAQRIDPRVVVDSITTADAIVSRAMAPWRFSTWMLTLFAGLGFLLAAVGLFGVVSLDVANRRHELAVRVALGARRGDVLRSVLVPAGSRVLAGLLVGALAAAAAARGVSGLLFGVSPHDATTWFAVLLLVVLVVALASYLPARRAARIDPMTLLRQP